MNRRAKKLKTVEDYMKLEWRVEARQKGVGMQYDDGRRIGNYEPGQIVELPDLPGCSFEIADPPSWSGEKPTDEDRKARQAWDEEYKRKLEAAKRSWIESALARGEPIPEPPKRKRGQLPLDAPIFVIGEPSADRFIDAMVELFLAKKRRNVDGAVTRKLNGPTEGVRHALAEQVFETISSRLLSKAGEIAGFVATGNHFEEWLNWEALTACAQSGKFAKVTPKPNYTSFATALRKKQADLLISDASGERIAVEVALVCDETQGKWIRKLDEDWAEMDRSLMPRVLGLLIVVVASSSPVRDAPGWAKWLSRARCWGAATTLEAAAPLPPKGELLIKGWIGVRTQETPCQPS